MSISIFSDHFYLDETESDSHDERPTEATDDGIMFISLEFLHACVIIVLGNLPNEPQVDPDERSIQSLLTLSFCWYSRKLI